jgi:glycosyltransferase involved in cell wall biosynthesis
VFGYDGEDLPEDIGGLMRIRFVTLYFPPEVGAAQRRISELARRLAGKGHDVTVLTGFPNYPSGAKPHGYRGKLIMKEARDGCTIIRVPHYIAPNRGFLRRIMIHISFAVSASLYSLFMKKDDVAYVESPPLFNGFIALTMKWIRRIPYCFNIADLWPQTAIELGALRNKRIIAAAQYLERLFYNQAARILAVTAGIRKFIVDMGYDKNKVPLITNGVDHTVFTDMIEPDGEIAKYRRDGRMLAVYAGTHGMAHALNTILQAAERLRGEQIQFMFIGDGPEKKPLMALAKDHRLENVTFLDPLKPERMPAVLRAADVAVIPLRDLPLFDSAMPSKCFEAMAAGKPVMLSVRGEMARHIQQAGCGLTAEPENVDQIVAAFRKFLEIGEEGRRDMGRRGREYVVEHFSREKIVATLEAHMRRVVDHEI